MKQEEADGKTHSCQFYALPISNVSVTTPMTTRIIQLNIDSSG